MSMRQYAQDNLVRTVTLERGSWKLKTRHTDHQRARDQLWFGKEFEREFGESPKYTNGSTRFESS